MLHNVCCYYVVVNDEKHLLFNRTKYSELLPSNLLKCISLPSWLRCNSVKGALPVNKICSKYSIIQLKYSSTYKGRHFWNTISLTTLPPAPQKTILQFKKKKKPKHSYNFLVNIIKKKNRMVYYIYFKDVPSRYLTFSLGFSKRKICNISSNILRAIS